MKRILTIIAIALLAQFAQAARPEYKEGQYYVWTNGALATNALNYINGTGWFPLTGNNAKTGKLAPNKAKTTKWAEAVLKRVDGKFVFPRIPEKIMDHVGVSEAAREAFFTAFKPAVEVYKSDWFPKSEMEGMP